jgi:hypothetical protein
MFVVKTTFQQHQQAADAAYTNLLHNPGTGCRRLSISTFQRQSFFISELRSEVGLVSNNVSVPFFSTFSGYFLYLHCTFTASGRPALCTMPSQVDSLRGSNKVSRGLENCRIRTTDSCSCRLSVITEQNHFIEVSGRF